MEMSHISPEQMTRYTGLKVSMKRGKVKHYFPRQWPKWEVRYENPQNRLWKVEDVGQMGVTVRATIRFGPRYHDEEACTVRLSWEVVEAIVQAAIGRLQKVEEELETEIWRRREREFEEQLEKVRLARGNQ